MPHEITELVSNVEESDSDFIETPESIEGMKYFLQEEALDLKPDYYKISPLKWRHACRETLRGNDLIVTGPSGTGKTLLVIEVVKALGRPFYYFNLGSTQDPQKTLVGTREAEDGTTRFEPSQFVEAIQTEDAVVLLDEITRANPDAWNILMPVLDDQQRYLQLDGAQERDVIPVADGVSFQATANVGVQYTAARELDRAIRERFSIIEADVLDKEEEFEMLNIKFPEVEDDKLESIAAVAGQIRFEANSDSIVDRIMSTRQSVKVAEQVRDGYDIHEALQMSVLPYYEDDSRREYIDKVIQGIVDTDGAFDDLFGDNDRRFANQL